MDSFNWEKGPHTSREDTLITSTSNQGKESLKVPLYTDTHPTILITMQPVQHE